MPIPTVLWAQRSDKLYLTIDLQDIKDQQVDLQPGSLSFKATGGTQQEPFELNIEFNKEVDTEASKVAVNARNVFMVLVKKEQGHWPRLTKGKQDAHIKCDWSKWVSSKGRAVLPTGNQRLG